ncbi:hypothetical protein GR160_17760 [Flavobacterium sp. Sd200]|uniref:hypothetical protein n=1 Tax=Flavobacterium sp. Sd200 TaxID=2692211 RepID=UPI00136D5E1B|nr:hypothetical protein [Flavobacterium sp. Sd200]MXN93076.1 hypothetical protein [Flavobacterium sp. Sd200]
MSLSDTDYIKAIRLFNLPNGDCSFEEGFLPNATTIENKGFFAQTQIEPYQRVAHPAPRRQYVVTLKGTLRFEVTNGDAFIIEPGVLLLAEDVLGLGHTWRLIEDTAWHRLYIPLHDDADSHFIKKGHDF